MLDVLFVLILIFVPDLPQPSIELLYFIYAVLEGLTSKFELVDATLFPLGKGFSWLSCDTFCDRQQLPGFRHLASLDASSDQLVLVPVSLGQDTLTALVHGVQKPAGCNGVAFHATSYTDLR